MQRIVSHTPTSRQVETVPKTSGRAELEAQLIEAHAKLRRGRDASRLVTLVRHGPFEVRLVEPLQNLPESLALFWMELFDHDRRLSIDSVGNCGLEDAVTAAENFVARAVKLSDTPHSWRRST